MRHQSTFQDNKVALGQIYKMDNFNHYQEFRYIFLYWYVFTYVHVFYVTYKFYIRSLLFEILFCILLSSQFPFYHASCYYSDPEACLNVIVITILLPFARWKLTRLRIQDKTTIQREYREIKRKLNIHTIIQRKKVKEWKRLHSI